MLQAVKSVRVISPFRLSTILAIALFAASPAVAHDQESAFEMTVIRDAAYGGRVVAGQFDEAISRINAARVRPSQKFFAETNLCVAYTKSGDLESAHEACDEALALAFPRGEVLPESRARIARRYEALALSNRGVLRAVSGDSDRARQDFRDALDLEAGLSAPGRNLAHLDAGTAGTVTMLQTDH